MKHRESQENQKNPLRWLARLLLLLVVVFSCFVASIFLYLRWQEARLSRLAFLQPAASNLNPLELLYLESYLALNAESLQVSAGTGSEKLDFYIEPGQTAETIANNLEDGGLLGDAEPFVRYVRYVGLDDQLDIGKYRLSSDMTVLELASALSQAGVVDVELSFLNGWRIAEMVEYLSVVRPAKIDPREFAEIAEGRIPHDLSAYSFLESKPSDATLEGYLFPGRYVVPVDAGASVLIDMMLSRFGQEVSDQLLISFGRNGMSVQDAVTLASIIEKETKVTVEKSLMASVYSNRLHDGMLLQADPTVQYVIGYDAPSDSWWKSPLKEADLKVDSPYNTYLYQGLPPGPITNPSLASLQAVATPADTNFFFFVADCDAEVAGSHAFSRTFEEHLVKVNQCRE